MPGSEKVGELANKVAVVTGGTRGIGFAVAAALVGAGARVVVTGRNRAAGETAAARLKRTDDVVFVEADQGSDSDWTRVMERTLSTFGRVDVLVANAGQSENVPTAEMTLDQFRALTRVHLKGCFLGVKHAVASMRGHGEGGAVILMSSIVGKVGVPGYIHYSAAKGGLRLMAKSAALELGPEKIRVNAILPGMIHTDMTAGFDERRFAPMIPLGKFGEAEDIARAALFLASDRGKFVTGIELVVDGGWTVQ